MNKLIGKEIIEKLIEKGITVSDFAFENYYSKDLDLGPIEEVHQRGGEGMGDHWESVKYFKDHDVYLKVVGFYQSHYGTDFYDDWNCVREVKPKEKTITIYE